MVRHRGLRADAAHARAAEALEEQVVELGARKKALFERLIMPGETVLSAMSEQEIRGLFE